MKKTITLLSFVLVALSIISFDTLSNLSNKGMFGYTAALGEPTCAGCHGVGSTGSISIASSPSFANGYIAGATYTISVTVAESGKPKFGFDFEGLKADTTCGGTLSVIAGTTDVQIKTYAGDSNAVHTGIGNATANSHIFNFLWRAPAKGSSTITFYTTGMAANGNGTNDSGDHMYKTSLAVPESTTNIFESASSAIYLSVFPNPASEKIFMNYTLEKNANISAQLYSIAGNNSYDLFSEIQSAGEQKREVDLPQQLSAGIYLLKLSLNEKKSCYRKVIVQ